MPPERDLNHVAINPIGTLAIDVIQKANSGPPGTPMEAAPSAYTLWQRILRYDPSQPDWHNRDRFVLSSGQTNPLAALGSEFVHITARFDSRVFANRREHGRNGSADGKRHSAACRQPILRKQCFAAPAGWPGPGSHGLYQPECSMEQVQSNSAPAGSVWDTADSTVPTKDKRALIS